MIKNIPKEIINNKLKKSDLSEDELKIYTRLQKYGYRHAIEKYFDWNPENPKALEKIKEQAGIIAVFLNNNSWWINSAFIVTNQGQDWGRLAPQAKRYRRLLQNTLIPDENKMLFLRRYINDNITNPMTIDPTAHTAYLA